MKWSFLSTTGRRTLCSRNRAIKSASPHLIGYRRVLDRAVGFTLAKFLTPCFLFSFFFFRGFQQTCTSAQAVQAAWRATGVKTHSQSLCVFGFCFTQRLNRTRLLCLSDLARSFRSYRRTCFWRSDALERRAFKSESFGAFHIIHVAETNASRESTEVHRASGQQGWISGNPADQIFIRRIYIWVLAPVSRGLIFGRTAAALAQSHCRLG